MKPVPWLAVMVWLGGYSVAEELPLTDLSLYQVESVWTNDAGEKIKLPRLRGQVQVVTMFFASCAYACPANVNELKKIEAALPEPLRSRTRFVLVTFDAERDTPAALRLYRQRQDLDPRRWTLLRGQPDDVQELAALLGVRYKQDARGQFAHSNLITVLDAEGEIVHQLSGMKQDIPSAIKAIEKAATRPHPSQPAKP